MEEMDRFKMAWQRQPIEPSLDAPGGAVGASVRQRLEAFHRAIRLRDAIETGCAVGGIILFGYLFVTLHGVLVKLGAAVIIAGLALIVVTLRRARLTGLARRTDAAVRDFCVAGAANVDAQIRLLRSVGWWYLGPVISGVNLFFFGMRGPTLDTLGYFAGTLLLAVFIYRLNVRAVTRRLEPMRSQLLAILEQMPKTEEADQNRRDD